MHSETETLNERYGKPAAAVVPIEMLEALRWAQSDPQPASRPVPSAAERHSRLIDALDRLRDVVELETPEQSEATFEAFNRAYRASRGRD